MGLLLAAFVLYLTLLAATIVYALRKGGKTERLGAVTLLIAIVLSQFASTLGPSSRGPDGPGVETDLLVIDLALFLALLAIAYRSTKFWPIWAAAAQLIAVLTHWAVVLNPSLIRTIYATAQPFWIFPMLAAIAIGTRAHQKSLRQTA